MNALDAIKLTEYSHGAGCGCKISPALLEDMLKTEVAHSVPDALLVGNHTKDDAAAFDLGNGTAVLSTTDFFMPIVDDPFKFGQIAATNAISDIYAMGGTPLMAIAIFGWPIDKLPAEVGQKVIEGGRQACANAGIPLAGGHSIDAPEPIFGLAVTGLVETDKLRRNDTAEPGCQLFLTKPLGIGILTTAQKQKKIAPEHLEMAIEQMCTLNCAGAAFAQLPDVTAMTDVTGFGLLGHLLELCEGSDVAAEIDYDAVPILPHVKDYLAQGCTPGGTQRNFASYGHKVGELTDEQKYILCDPQTSGGLLVAVREQGVPDFLKVAREQGLDLQPIGRTLKAREPRVVVK
ncbi:selenophosphate synthase [Sulfurivirga caldicuralii]|uniref:Selenide, water dikinase n=1 Tax=Sulfurivirga caldicuralii TaxID=364032 RepID=A0A1N6DMK8_9GAMM|nr:selenide, water dikinase SelD [Sulfurivirga caldicuralii]SIN72005.1 selenophosphate synthase [Sulfurivirga caldicuralii]